MSNEIDFDLYIRQLDSGAGDEAQNLSVLGTDLLDTCGYVSKAQLRRIAAKLGSQTLMDELPRIAQELGIAHGDRDDTIVYGIPRAQDRQIVIYERSRTITLYSDGTGKFVTPSPSGQSVMIQSFNLQGVHGRHTARTRYEDHLVQDTYRDRSCVHSRGSDTVHISHFRSSRAVSVGGRVAYWGRENFQPMEMLVSACKASRPVKVDPATVEKVVGCHVSNPVASGWLLAFDQVAGEAIVSTDDWASPGCIRPFKTVNDLTGLYPVELWALRGDKYLVYRDAEGHLISAKQRESGYELFLLDMARAYSPVEVGVGINVWQPLHEILGLDWTVGLRALGGYQTMQGGRIPVSLN